jgi:hypothetical protein
MMAFFEFVAELFIRLIFEGVLNFVGAAIRFLFIRKNFREILNDGINPSVGLAGIGIIVLLVVLLK